MTTTQQPITEQQAALIEAVRSLAQCNLEYRETAAWSKREATCAKNVLRLILGRTPTADELRMLETN